MSSKHPTYDLGTYLPGWRSEHWHVVVGQSDLLSYPSSLLGFSTGSKFNSIGQIHLKNNFSGHKKLPQQATDTGLDPIGISSDPQTFRENSEAQQRRHALQIFHGAIFYFFHFPMSGQKSIRENSQKIYITEHRQEHTPETKNKN